MTTTQAERILATCGGKIDFEKGVVFNHVVLKGWFDAEELEAVLTLMRARDQHVDGARGSRTADAGDH